MNRTLTVLLCLGELRGKDEGWDPIISQILVPRTPGPQVSVGTELLGEEDVAQPHT